MPSRDLMRYASYPSEISPGGASMEHRRVKTSDDVLLHYVEAGSGDPLIMIPGWSQSAAEFRHQFESLAALRRVIALDMRGHGESEKPSNGYCVERLAKDMFDVIGALRLEG